MAGAKNHDYHILPPSIWPLFGSLSALVMASGAIMWMHGGHLAADKANGGGWIFFAGLAGVLFTMYSWWADVVREAHHGDHTPVVQLHFRYGMILFIASEVMFFVGWFWAFFDFSLFPTAMAFVDGQVERAAEGAGDQPHATMLLLGLCINETIPQVDLPESFGLFSELCFSNSAVSEAVFKFLHG